jgi:hypothetical protein
MSLVTDAKFNEVVNNTTAYLQQLMDRCAKLEARVDELEKAKTASRRGKVNDE